MKCLSTSKTLGILRDSHVARNVSDVDRIYKIHYVHVCKMLSVSKARNVNNAMLTKCTQVIYFIKKERALKFPFYFHTKWCIDTATNLRFPVCTACDILAS